MSLPQNAALRTGDRSVVVPSGTVRRYRHVGWEESMMWLGPREMAADF